MTNPIIQIEEDVLSRAEKTQDELELWFQTSLGRSLLANQRLCIERVTKSFYGVHQAEIGVSHRIPVGNHSNLAHGFYVLSKWQEGVPENTVISGHDDLAIQHDTCDLVILHHALDFAKDPHQTLREAYRILKPSGHLVVVGFNPYSTWGLRALFSRRKAGPWACRFLSATRLEDWLNLLGFKVGKLRHRFYVLPFNQRRLKPRVGVLDNILNSRVPLGAYYIVVAQKRVGVAVGRKPQWRAKTNVVGMPVANRVDN